MLKNVCENCIRILEEEKRRQFRMFVILWKKWKKLASSSINQSVRSQKTVRTSENIAAEAETPTHTLKSLRTQNESLFDVDFGPEA